MNSAAFLSYSEYKSGLAGNRYICNSSTTILNFEALYEANKKRVYNLVLQYVQSAEDAQEITQDVFVAVHQALPSFKEESSHSTWIYRIAINCSLDFIKARKRKKRFGFLTSIFYEDSGEVKHDIPSFDHPGVLMENKEATRRVFEAINELPDNQKTALILSKIEQKSQIEVAEIMETSPKAVESLIQRAKANMQKKLKESEG